MICKQLEEVEKEITKLGALSQTEKSMQTRIRTALKDL